MGRPAIQRRAKPIWRKEEPLLLLATGRARLQIRSVAELDHLDQLEESGCGGDRARLQLSARDRRLLVHVPRRAQSSGSGDEPPVGLVSEPGVRDRQVYVWQAGKRAP